MSFNAACGGGIGVSSKLILCLLYFILVVTAGWALKHYAVGSYTLAAYALLITHSVICFLRYTHPNVGQVQRQLCEQTRLHAAAIFVTLINGELLQIGAHIRLHLDWRSFSLCLYACVLGLALAQHCLGTQRLQQLHHLSLDVCMLWNIYCLCCIAFAGDYNWPLGLASLVLLNHFVLWRLALHYNISQQEIGTVGMSFYVLFAINATQELLESLASR